MPSSLKTIIKNGLLILLSISLTLLLVELVLRQTHFKAILVGGLPDTYYVNHPTLGIDIAPNHPKETYYFADSHKEVFSNALGCMDAPFDPNKPYIYLGGDSFTWSYNPYEQKWGTLLETWSNTQVLACGVSTYDLKQDLHKAEITIDKTQKNPDLIIVGLYLENDLNLGQEVMIYKGKLVKKAPMEELERKFKNHKKYGTSIKNRPQSLMIINQFLSNHSILYSISRSFFKTLYFKLNKSDNIYRKQKQKKLDDAVKPYILRFKTLANSLGAELVFVLIPQREQVYPFLLDGITNEPNKSVSNFLTQHNIKHLDLLPTFQKYANLTPRDFLSAKDDLYWRFDIHWNPNGDRLAALSVLNYLLNQNLISVNDPEQTKTFIETKYQKFLKNKP